MTNDTNNTHNATSHDDHFTIVELCREFDINAKIARRRMRDAIRRNDERALRAIAQRRERDVTRDDMRVKHEFANDVRDDVLSIIKRD